MSVTSPTVPLIAITTEDTDEENDQYGGMDIADVATDIEDLEDFGVDKKKRKQKVHKPPPKRTDDMTDDEEIEGVGDEFDTYLVKHENPVSIQDVLDLEEPPTYEESFKVEGKGPKNRRKLKTQTSTVSSSHLGLDDGDINQATTDIEDFNDSGDDEEISDKDEETELDLMAEITQDLGSTDIADSVKKFLNGTPSPLATPIENLSDAEGERSNSKQLGVQHRSGKMLTPMSLSPQFSDLTDTEILQSDDSNDEDTQKRQKNLRVKNRKHKNIRGAVTDTEDLDLSEDEAKKLVGQITISKSPNFHVEKNRKYRSESAPAIPSIRFNHESDRKLKKKPTKKAKTNTLNVELSQTEGLTDIEDMEADDSAMEEEPIINEQDEIDITNELDSYYGTVEEKSSTKSNQKLYKTESFISKQLVAKPDPDADKVETDEEDCEQDTMAEDNEEIEISEDICSIKFVPYKKTKPLQLPKKKTPKLGNLLAVNNEDENLLTDTEYLNSSDEEKEAVNQIAAVITGSKDEDTGSESMEEMDVEFRNYKNVPDEYLPKVVREQIRVKETHDDNIVTVSPLPDDENLLSINVDPQYHTDVEDLSGAEEELIEVNDEDIDMDSVLPEVNMTEEGTIKSIDLMKSPVPERESEGETDYEEIRTENKARTKKNVYLKDFLAGKKNQEGKLTDMEDFELSDAENLDRNLMVREIHSRSLTPGIKTDMEDLTTSGDDIDDNLPLTPEHSMSSRILKEMGGSTVASKDGNGPFSKQERKKLYKKNRPVEITPSSPMQTDTDDMFTSADDESNTYSRAETATPAQMRQALDDATNSKVTTQHTQKIDLDAADEVMYIKGGGFISDQYTDVSDMGMSDDEYYNAVEKNVEDKNQVCVCIDGENGDNVNISVGEEKSQVIWNEGKVSSSSEKEWGTIPESAIDQQEEPSQPIHDTALQESSSGWQESTTTTRTMTGTSTSQGIKAEEKDEAGAQQPAERGTDQYQLSAEMKELLEEMEKQAKK